MRPKAAEFPTLQAVKTAIRSALFLPGLVAAASVVPTSFGVADPDGIWSLDGNPAGLGRMSLFEAGIQTGADQTFGRDMVALGTGGLAGAWDRLPGAVDPEQRAQDLRLGFGTSLGGDLYAGVAAIRHDPSGASARWSGDLGLLWQPIPRFSAGWILPNCLAPDATRSKGHALAVALRPLGGVDLQLGLEAWLSGSAWVRSSWDDPDWEAALRLRPLSWLALDARVDPLHPERIGGGVSVQMAPTLGFFARSAPAPRPSRSEFQAIGARYAAGVRPAAGVPSPVLLYRVPSALSEGTSGMGRSGGLRKLRDDFRQIAATRGLRTVVLDLGAAGLSPSAAGELRRQVAFLRSRGLEVRAWAHDLDMGTISVLSAADKAAIDPQGMVRARGLAMDMPYFGGLLSRHGVQVQVVKTGPWKSAMEPYESERMSPEAREDLQRLLLDLDSTILAGVVRGRKVDPAALVAYVDSGSALPASAVRARLVDTLLEESELAAWGGAPRRGTLSLPLRGEVREEWGEGRRVAVLLLEGQVVDREGDAGMVPWSRTLSAERAARAVDMLREDPSVSAVVLRVNSPGGAVSGSERLRRAVERLAEKKPVAASFGSVAASGAYLFSLPAERIWAEPEAVVGSIGAFAAKINVQGLMDSLGIRVERIRTAPHAGSLSPFAPFDSLEKARVTEFVEDAHREFAAHVRRFRRLDSAAMLRVDGGRVFAGTRAAGLGLVDSLGGLDDALRWARARARLPGDARVEWVEPGRRGLVATLGAAVVSADALSGPGSGFGRLMDAVTRPAAGVWAQVPWEPTWE